MTVRTMRPSLQVLHWLQEIILLSHCKHFQSIPKEKNPCISCSKWMRRCLSWRSPCSPWTADTYRLLMNTTCRAVVISAADKCPAGELAKFKDKSSNLRPDKCVVWVGVELLLMSGFLFRALLTEIRPTDDWNPHFWCPGLNSFFEYISARMRNTFHLDIPAVKVKLWRMLATPDDVQVEYVSVEWPSGREPASLWGG